MCAVTQSCPIFILNFILSFPRIFLLFPSAFPFSSQLPSSLSTRELISKIISLLITHSVFAQGPFCSSSSTSFSCSAILCILLHLCPKSGHLFICDNPLRTSSCNSSALPRSRPESSNYSQMNIKIHTMLLAIMHGARGSQELGYKVKDTDVAENVAGG